MVMMIVQLFVLSTLKIRPKLHKIDKGVHFVYPVIQNFKRIGDVIITRNGKSRSLEGKNPMSPMPYKQFQNKFRLKASIHHTAQSYFMQKS